MTVTLTPEQEKFVTQQVENGHFRSAVEVINQSLNMLQAQEQFIRSQEMELREKVSEGLSQTNSVDLVEGKKAIADLKERLRNRGRP